MFLDILIKGVEHVHPVTVKLFIYFILVNDKNLSDFQRDTVRFTIKTCDDISKR